MGFQPVPNTVSAEFVHWNGESYSENVLHFKFTAQPGIADMEDLASDLRAWYAAGPNMYKPANIFLSKIIVKDLSAQNAPGIEYTAGLPLPGQEGTYHSLPMNATCAVKVLTGMRGRSYRGRIYHIGLCQEQVIGDKLSAPVMTNLTNAYASLLTAITSVDAAWVVVSRWSGGLPRATGITTQVTAVQIDQVVDSQRRRLMGRGW